MKILILASNPHKDLNLDDELRIVQSEIDQSGKRDQFLIEKEVGVRVGDLQSLVLRYKPEIIHFCGHGSGQEGLIFKVDGGGEQRVRADALANLFRLCPSVKCVLLNACYSEEQASAIARHTDYVIGMNHTIQDNAAIAFSKGFYTALGNDCSIELSFEFGKNAIQLEVSESSIKRSSATAVEERKAEVVGVVETIELKEHEKPRIFIQGKEQTTSDLDQRRSNQSISERKREEVLLKIDTSLSEAIQTQPSSLAEDNRILRKGQDTQPHNPSTTTRQSWFTNIGMPKVILACISFLVVSTGSFFIYGHGQTTTKYPQLQTYLKNSDWKDADDETARIMWTLVDRGKEKGLRVEDFEKIPCSDLHDIDNLWEKYSNKHFGFDVQKRIWLASQVNSDLEKFIVQVGWAGTQKDGSFFYWSMDGQSFDLSMQKGKLPWAVTYYEGNNDTRKKYMAQLVQCFP